VAADVHVTVIDDPLTTVIGRVVDNAQQPLAGVTVSVLTRSATTALDGTFSITGVGTLKPVVIVSASLSANGTILTGLSAPAQPVRGGTTDVGDIVAAATSFENNLGTLTPACNYCTVTVPLPFAFTIGANTYNRIYINNGYVYTDFDSIEAFCCDLSSTPGGGGGGAAPPDAGLYVNDQLPGRLVVTWWKKYTFDTGQDLNTIQIILFADGRIQYGYQTVSPARTPKWASSRAMRRRTPRSTSPRRQT
jgi:hypothetical protein